MSQNKQQWTLNLLQDKKLQKIMAKYTDEIHSILQDELMIASQLTKDYLNYPHNESAPLEPVL